MATKKEVTPFTQTQADIADIKARFNWTPEQLDKMLVHVDEKKVVDGAKKTCTSMRTALTKVHKEAKAPILAAGKALDAEKKELEEAIKAVEAPIDAAIKRRKDADEASKDDEIARLKAQLAEAQGALDVNGIKEPDFHPEEVKVTLRTAKQRDALKSLITAKQLSGLLEDKEGTRYSLEITVARKEIVE